MEFTIEAHSEEARPLITNFFTITGKDLNIQECTRFLGLQPTETGETIQKGTSVDGRTHFRDAFWSIEFTKEPSWEIEEGLIKILDILWPRRECVTAFLSTTGHSALFGTNVSIYASRPLYVLSPQTLSRMAFFETEWGLDIFDYSEE